VMPTITSSRGGSCGEWDPPSRKGEARQTRERAIPNFAIGIPRLAQVVGRPEPLGFPPYSIHVHATLGAPVVMAQLNWLDTRTHFK